MAFFGGGFVWLAVLLISKVKHWVSGFNELLPALCMLFHLYPLFPLHFVYAYFGQQPAGYAIEFMVKLLN